MSRIVRRLALIVVCAAVLAPATAAEAQWYGGQGGHAGQRPPPLYPYELQPGQSYAVQVAPGTYVIHHPAQSYDTPAARRGVRYIAPRHRPAPAATPRPMRTHANRALIEELRRRDRQRAAKRAARHAAALKRAAARRTARKVVEKATEKAAKQTAKRRAKQAAKQASRKTVGRKPDKIINTRKVVQDKPLVIVTRRVVEDPPKIITRRHYVDNAPPATRNDDPRVIHADAEITILGPDRMSIRLVRKQGEPLVVGSAAPRPAAMPQPRPKHIERKRTGTRFKARK